MKYEKDIAAHVISNIALIESTKNVIDDVESTIFRQFNAVAKKHIKKSNLLLANDNKFELYHGDADFYFSAVDWEETYENQIAWYLLVYGEEEEGEDYSLLSHLLGESSKNAYLRLQFTIEKDELGVGLGLRKFRSIFNAAFFKIEELSRLGFQLSECNTFIELKFHLDAKLVAEEYPVLEESFKPLIKVLDTVFEAHSHFEAMVEEVKLLAKAEVSDVQEVGAT